MRGFHEQTPLLGQGGIKDARRLLNAPAHHIPLEAFVEISREQREVVVEDGGDVYDFSRSTALNPVSVGSNTNDARGIS